MKDEELINRLIKERVMELMTRATGLTPYQTLEPELEPLIQGGDDEPLRGLHPEPNL